MHSKWRYKFFISVFGHSRGTWVFSKLRGIQKYFPENFRCNLTYYEGDNFSDSFFHHFFESENFRIPFLLSKKNSLTRWVKYEKLNVGCPWPELWKTTIGLIQDTFLYISLPLICMTATWNVQKTSWFSLFMEEMWYMFLFTFSTAAHFV